MAKKPKYKIYDMPDGTTLNTGRLDGSWWCCRIVVDEILDGKPHETSMVYMWGTSEEEVLSMHGYLPEASQTELGI